MAAGLLAHLAGVSASLARGDEPGAQAKSSSTASKGAPAEKKPAPPKPRIAVFRLAGDVTELPPDETFSFGAVGGHLAPRPDRADEEGREGPEASRPSSSSTKGGRSASARPRSSAPRWPGSAPPGKEIYAHADSLSTREYVLLSGASRLSVVPTADLWVTGLFGESPYLRGLLDKIGVKPEFLTCGAYKSAAEIFLRDGPSPEAEAMQNWLLDGIYATSLSLIAQGRKVSVDRVRDVDRRAAPTRPRRPRRPA